LLMDDKDLLHSNYTSIHLSTFIVFVEIGSLQ
jgi:hypothetical protein